MAFVSNLFGSTTPTAGAFPIAGSSGRIDPLWLRASDVLDQLSVAVGSLAVRTSTGWQALQPSTSGLVLTSQGIGAVPIWSASSGSGGGGTVGPGTVTQLAIFNTTTTVGSTASFIDNAGTPTITAVGTNKSVLINPTGTGAVYIGTQDAGAVGTSYFGLYGTTDFTSRVMIRRYSADANGAELCLNKSRGTSTTPANVASGDILGQVSGGSWQGSTSWNPNPSYMAFKASESWTSGTNGTCIVWATNPNGAALRVEFMKLTHDGALLINSGGSTLPATLPRARLAVIGTNYDTACIAVRAYQDDGTSPKLNFGLSKGTVSSPTALTFPYNIGYIMWGGNDGTATWVETAAYLVVQTTQNWGSGAHGTKMIFATNPNGSGSVSTGMVIDQDQRVLIATSSNDGVNTLQVNGSIKAFSTTASSSTTTGSGIFAGGVGIAGALFTGGAITTAAPVSGTAGAWKHGIYVAGAPAATGYVQLDIGGVLYKLLAST